MATRPIHEVFEKRAQGVGHMLRDRIWRTRGWAANEPLTVNQINNDDGTITLQYHRESDGHGCIEFRNIKASGMEGDLHYGEETLLNSEQLGAAVEEYHNGGTHPVTVKFRDLFSHETSHETTDDKSAGTSVSVEVTAEESIEGFADISETVSSEVHAEIAHSESSGESTSTEFEGEEETEVGPGECIKVTESRTRADTEQEVTGHAKFTFGLAIGKHSGGKFVGGNGRGYARWNSWDDFLAVVNGHAPDNWPLAESFKHRHAYHADRWALDPLPSEVKYKVKFTGKQVRDYRVEQC